MVPVAPREKKHVQQGLLMPWHFVGNFVANKLAEAAAESATVTPHIIDAFKMCQRRAYKVRTRLVAAHRLHFDDLPTSRKRAGNSLDSGPAKRASSSRAVTSCMT